MTKIEGVPDGYELVRIGRLLPTDIGKHGFINTNGVREITSGEIWREGIYAIVRKIEPPKPIEPPEGYRLIQEGVVVGGDLCFTAGWRESERVGDCIEYLIKNGFAKAYARKIEPQYRPFANAAEFAPHRDTWLVDEDGELVRVVRIRPDCKIATCHGSISFADAFKRYKFEDGTPFGVEA